MDRGRDHRSPRARGRRRPRDPPSRPDRGRRASGRDRRGHEPQTAAAAVARRAPLPGRGRGAAEPGAGEPARLDRFRVSDARPRACPGASARPRPRPRRIRDRAAAPPSWRLARVHANRAHRFARARDHRVPDAALRARSRARIAATARRNRHASRTRAGSSSLPRRAAAPPRRRAKGDPLEGIGAPERTADEALRARDEPRFDLPRQRRVLRAVLDPGRSRGGRARRIGGRGAHTPRRRGGTPGRTRHQWPRQPHPRAAPVRARSRAAVADPQP